MRRAFEKIRPPLAVEDEYLLELSVLDSLAPLDRGILYLADVAGFPLGKIAADLELTPAAVRKRASRARAHLRTELGENLASLRGGTMTRGTDLLERRAERGTHRGSANVWANSRPSTKPAVEPTGSWLFRLALGVWLCIGVALLLASDRGNEVDTQEAAVSQSSEDNAEVSDDDLPLPILIDGFQLDDAITICAADGELVCDEEATFDELGDFDPELGISTPTIVIFGDEAAPFTGPVVGVESFDGGFRTWTLNLDQQEANEIIAQVSRAGNAWGLPASTGLVEIERFEESTDPLNTWQLDFSSDTSRATLQPLRAFGEPASEWDWIVPLVRNTDFGPTVDFATISLEPVDVLGREGLALVLPFLSDEGEVDGTLVSDIIWAEGQCTYRLNARGPDTDSAEIIDQLVLADRAEWTDLVLDARFDESAEAITMLVILVFLVVGAVLLAGFLVKRKWLSAVIVLGAAGFGYSFISFPNVLGALLIGFGGLTLSLLAAKKAGANNPDLPTPADAESQD